MHTTDSSNGGGNSAGNVIWTSPINGTISISGGVWMARDIGRSSVWGLSAAGVGLTDGSMFPGNPYSSSNQFDFSAGSGGALILEDITVSVGDVVQLSLYRNASPGDFMGVNLAITQTTVVPVPAAVWLFWHGSSGESKTFLRR